MINLACLLCGIYLQGGVSVHHGTEGPLPQGYHYDYDANVVKNPYGILALGDTFYESRHFKWDIELRHESAIPTKSDFGANSIQLSVTWRPFR